MASPVFGQAMNTPKIWPLPDSSATRYLAGFRSGFYQQLPGGEERLWGIGPAIPKIRRSASVWMRTKTCL